jgi:general secretion pathway protein A
LLGDVGTGKSILAKALVEDLGSTALTAVVLYPELDPLDFLNVIGGAWGFDGRSACREDFYDRLEPFLAAAVSRDKRVLLVVDEVQRLSPELLAEIRTLASLQGDAGASRVNILLVGQEGASALLSRPENATLQKKVTVTGFTQPLKMAEVSTYIRHHLRLAGSERVVFTSEAVRAIATMSRGTPRLINTICDLALVAGARRNADSIDGDLVMECADRLGLGREERATPKEGYGRGMLKPVIVAAGGLLLVMAITGYVFSPWERAERAEFPTVMSTESMTPAAPPSASSAEAAAEPQVESRSSAPRPEPPARASVARTARVPESPAVLPERQRPEARTALQPGLAVEPPRLPRRPAILLPPPASPGDTLSRGLDQPDPLRAGPPTPARGESTAVRTATRQDDDAMDPTAIIDWVLRTHPARQN